MVFNGVVDQAEVYQVNSAGVNISAFITSPYVV